MNIKIVQMNIKVVQINIKNSSNEQKIQYNEQKNSSNEKVQMNKKNSSNEKTGAYEGGRAPPALPPLRVQPPLRGALLKLNLLAFSFLRQSTFYIADHCTHPKLKDLEKN